MSHPIITREYGENEKEGEPDIDMIEEWNKLYDSFGKKSSKSKDDFTRLIVVKKGATLNEVLAECKKRFNVWCYGNDLDKIVIQNDRIADKDYEVLVRNTIEADEEYKNMSANDIRKKGIKGVTLLERLLLELKYFDETGKHLDMNNITLCTGSRGADGRVPGVAWLAVDDELRVHWYNPGSSLGYLRAREVVLL
jgi:hypothetical protein